VKSALATAPDSARAGRASVAKSTAVMAAGTVTSRLTGMVRLALLGAAIGAGTGAANAFEAANTLPNFFYAILAEGVLNAVLVPQIVRAFSRGHGEEYVHRLLTLATVALGVLTAALTASAAVWVWLFTQGWTPSMLALATVFAYWCLPQVFFYGLYALWSQVLNARGKFGAVMWAPVANNLVSIIGFTMFLVVFGRYDPTNTALGTWGGGKVALLAGTATLGIVVQALLLLGPMAKAGLRPQFRLGFRGFELGRAARMTGWTALSLVFSQGAMWVAIRLASAAQGAAHGQVVASNAIFAWALAIYIIPHSVITVSLTTALFTRMSEHATRGRFEPLRQELSYGIRTTSAFGFFFSAVMVVLAQPLARVLQPGISQAEVHALAGPIIAMSLGLVPLSTTLLVKRVYFALEDGRTLLALQVPMSFLFVAFSVLCFWSLPSTWWVIGIGLGQSLSFLAGAVLRLTDLSSRIGKLGAKRLLWMHARAAAAAVLVGELGYLLLLQFPGAGAASFGIGLAALASVGALMAAAYWFLLRLMDVGELEDFARSVFRGARGPRVP
jgi:putative peptidoglycan lipid II flippase